MAGRKGKSGGVRAGAGRIVFAPTQEQRKLVEQLSAFGIRIDEIPLFITNGAGKPISMPTLRKHFKTEIECGRLKANVKVANALYRNATEPSGSAEHGNITAQIFWLKTRGGWTESASKLEVSGPDGQPLRAVELSDDDLAAIVAGMR